MSRTLALLFVVLVSLYKIDAATLTAAKSFDDYIKILRAPLNIELKIRTVNAIWGEINHEYSNDVNKTTVLYHEITELLKNGEEDQTIYELQQQVRRHIIARHASLLANVFNSHSDNAEILKCHTYLIENFELEMLKVIYTKAIDEIMLFEKPEILASHLRNIYHKENANKKSLALTLHMQLHMLHTLQEQMTLCDNYMHNVAYYLSEIKHDEHYELLDKKLQENLAHTIKEMPKTLQYLFFKEYFCLSNDKDQYLYTGHKDLNIDDDRRYVFLWTKPDEVGTQGALISNITEYPSHVPGELNLKFSLKSKQFDMYWYLEHNAKKFKDVIAAWVPSEKPEKSDWSVKFVKDKLVFEQYGYLMCQSDEKHDEKRIYVNAYKDDDHNEKMNTCQWYIGECPL